MKWITGLIGTAGVPMRSGANRVQPWTLRPEKKNVDLYSK